VEPPHRRTLARLAPELWALTLHAGGLGNVAGDQLKAAASRGPLARASAHREAHVRACDMPAAGQIVLNINFSPDRYASAARTSCLMN
jgi:hypothetical protein